MSKRLNRGEKEIRVGCLRQALSSFNNYPDDVYTALPDVLR